MVIRRNESDPFILMDLLLWYIYSPIESHKGFSNSGQSIPVCWLIMLQFEAVFVRSSYCTLLHALPRLISIAIYEVTLKVAIIICMLLMRKASLGDGQSFVQDRTAGHGTNADFRTWALGYPGLLLISRITLTFIYWPCTINQPPGAKWGLYIYDLGCPHEFWKITYIISIL